MSDPLLSENNKPLSASFPSSQRLESVPAVTLPSAPVLPGPFPESLQAPALLPQTSPAPSGSPSDLFPLREVSGMRREQILIAHDHPQSPASHIPSDHIHQILALPDSHYSTRCLCHPVAPAGMNEYDQVPDNQFLYPGNPAAQCHPLLRRIHWPFHGAAQDLPSPHPAPVSVEAIPHFLPKVPLR